MNPEPQNTVPPVQVVFAPTGVGVYLRNFTQEFRLKWPAKKLAQRLKDYGIKHAAILACWDDHYGFQRNNQIVAGQYAEALHKQGIMVGLWGFPHPDRVAQYITRLTEATDECGGGLANGGPIAYWLHDPEIYWKFKGERIGLGMRGQGEAVQGVEPGVRKEGYLNDRADELVVEDMVARSIAGVPGCGLTSYGMAEWHPIPYRQILEYGHIWGSPQLYSVSPAMVDKGLKSWQERGSVVNIPSVPAFGKNSERALAKHLASFVDPGTPVDISGIIVWSYPQLNKQEFAILQEFSEKQGWS